MTRFLVIIGVAVLLALTVNQFVHAAVSQLQHAIN